MLDADKGVTLVELIVAITVTTLLAIFAFQLYGNFIKSNVSMKAESVLNEHLARASQILEKDIRMAGYNLPGNGLVVDISTPNNHVLHTLTRLSTTQTTLGQNVAATSTTIFVQDDLGVVVGQWVCLYDGSIIEYREIAHVGHNPGGDDTITVYNGLSNSWVTATAKVYFARCYTYSLETNGTTTSLVRRTHDHLYSISSDIEAINIIPKDQNGAAIASNFLNVRSVSVQLSKQINSINGQKLVACTIDASIRNPQ